MFWALFLSYFVYSSLHLEIPKHNGECLFYFKEHRKDLKYLIANYLQLAKKSIFISSFGITDKDIVHILESKSATLPVQIAFDTKENNLLPQGSNVQLFPYTKKSLMHRKVVGIDNEFLLLGSTNLTPLALKIHRNLIVCIRSKELYQAIQESRPCQTDSLSYYPLPETNKIALSILLQKLASAKQTISICMYVLTHQKIIEALIDAKNRGVHLFIYIDRGMANGVCKKTIALLQAHNIFVRTHLGGGLLHHKCALIDNSFIFGSANWTKAAFTKNDEYILFLDTLSPSQSTVIQRFFLKLHKSSLPISNLSVI